MAKIKEKVVVDASTEEKIKNAARAVFQKRGYAAARTRDIAEEAGINLALLNYYFRSKEKLFEIIMSESLVAFFHGISGALNVYNSTFEQKIELIAVNYLDMLIAEPDIPLFVLGEMRNRPENLFEKLPVRQILKESVFVQQFQEKVAAGQIKEPHFLHFMMNLLGLIAFPFIGRPLLMLIGELEDVQFNRMMQERKQLIPVWIKAMMEAE